MTPAAPIVPRPSVRLALDGPAGPVACGTSITGTVTVSVDEVCPDLHLVAGVGYRANGRAPAQTVRNWGHTESRELYAGAWQAGTYSYPFSLTAPDGCSYTGAIMSVTWYLRADIRTHTAEPFEVLSELEQPLELAPSPVAPADLARRKASECRRTQEMKATGGCLLTALALTLLGVIVTWFGAGHGSALPGLVVLVAGVGLLALVVRQAFMSRKIARTELRVASTVAWPGVAVPCAMAFEPKTRLEIERATVTLEGWEHVKQFTGLNRTTGPVNTHMVHRPEFALTPSPGPGDTGPLVRLSANVEIPVDAPCTFDADREVKFRWRLVFEVKPRRGPTWGDAVELTVLPRSGREE